MRNLRNYALKRQGNEIETLCMGCLHLTKGTVVDVLDDCVEVEYQCLHCGHKDCCMEHENE